MKRYGSFADEVPGLTNHRLQRYVFLYPPVFRLSPLSLIEAPRCEQRGISDRKDFLSILICSLTPKQATGNALAKPKFLFQKGIILCKINILTSVFM